MMRHLAPLCITAFAHAADSIEWKPLPPLPDPLGVAAPFAGASGGALLVAGGANFPAGMPWEGGKKTWHDRAWVLDAPNGAWREAGRLPRSLAYGVSLGAADSVLCIGGSDAERHHAEAFRLLWKSAALVIETLPALPVPLANAAGALVGGTAVVACGAVEPGEKSASVRAFALDAGAAAWRELPPLPAEARILPVAASDGDHFYLFGGAAIEWKNDKPMRRYLRDAWRYDAARGWQRLADMPKPLVAAASPAPVHNGMVLLVAGDDGSRAGFQPVEKHPGFPAMILGYDIAANAWSERGETPAPRATLPVVEWRGMFIFPSGEARPGVRSPEIWSFRK